MKTKLFIFTMFMILSASLIAQNTEKGKTAFAILGGINVQNLNGKNISGDKLENDLILGYHAGFNVQIPIAPAFYFQPGLLFSTKGAKNTTSISTSTIKLSYVELPLNFVYKGALGNGFIMLGFGPYVAYGIGGKVITEVGGNEVETDVEFQNTVAVTDPLLTTYFKGLDAGGNIFAGYETAGGLFLQLNTQFGMLNLRPENDWISDDKSVIKNTGFGVSLGYRF